VQGAKQELATNPCVPICKQAARMAWRTDPMRGVLLWLIGIPIPIIILLYLFNVI
jgi:hypothetical protein